MARSRRPKSPASTPDIQQPQSLYFNRELSWLEFNYRVLHEAIDPRTPLLERLKFIAIVSSNLDEYFMVRVAVLKQRAELGVTQRSLDGLTPPEQLQVISQHLRPMVTKQHRHFQDALRPQLAAQGIHLLNYTALNVAQRRYLEQYYEAQIFPVLTPLALDPGHPFPHVSNLSLNLAVIVYDEVTAEEHFARVKVPNVLPRFIPLPADLHPHRRGQTTAWAGVPLEQVIAHNLESLFPGMQIRDYHPFRITRDSDLALAEEEADDLLLAIEQELRKRQFGGSAVRIEINPDMPDPLRQTLLAELELTPDDLYEMEGMLCLRDTLFLTDLPLPHLKDPVWTPTLPLPFRRLMAAGNPSRPLEDEEDIFAILRRQDALVHHPYHSFAATVEQFIIQAAHDPDVLAIKMTLYRTSGDSPLVDALIAAAENGKQVAVLVELKARFDEQNNINWARKLEKVGIHVVYGLVGLKTHTKVVLVVRREEKGIRRYVHVGTGNYNPKTARTYTDLGLFSCREDLGADLTNLFNYLTGYSRHTAYRKLLVAPVNLRDRMLALIQREAEHSQNGEDGRIVAKMNALIDPDIIMALYQASQAGVQIDLIVRGMCCLRPGVEGLSDNIRVISIVGRFLEHSRMFYFRNGGEEELYLGSADWMPRNLERRVEAIAPVEDLAIARDIQEILGILLADNRQAWELQPDGRYIQRHPQANGAEHCAQKTLMDMALQTP